MDYPLLTSVLALFLLQNWTLYRRLRPYVAKGFTVIFTAIRRFQSFDRTFKELAQYGYGHVKEFSFVKSALRKEGDKLEQSLEKQLKVKSRALGPINKVLPEEGLSNEAILELMQSATKAEDPIWEAGSVSGAVYFGKRDHIELLNKAFNYYSISNPLHSDIWPSVMKFESEIIAMTAALVRAHPDDDVCGSTTSGGTESIILAIKAHRDYYCDRYQITEPELVCGVSAHAAVDKACDMLKIKLIKVDLDPKTFRVNLSALESAITSNTIMMYASAPSYPHGAIDPVEAMGRLAVKYGIGLHVDCCLGGFILPFAKKEGFSIPNFDFSVAGVTTMSLDTHKYGYALKGTSVVLYRHRELRHAQYFCYADWTGGMYATPTIAGSRSGGLIAQCWASMMSLGQKQYRAHTTDIFHTARRIADGVRRIPGLKICGEVDAMIVCFGSSDKAINIYSVSDEMHKNGGWTLNNLQGPPCLHLCCTVTHIGREEKFLKDLSDAVKRVRENPNPNAGNAAIYGLTGSLPPGPVNELLKAYNDVVLKV
eukprot:scaffold636_cov170-Ochromonas_danica.AAC.4